MVVIHKRKVIGYAIELLMYLVIQNINIYTVMDIFAYLLHKLKRGTPRFNCNDRKCLVRFLSLAEAELWNVDKCCLSDNAINIYSSKPP